MANFTAGDRNYTLKTDTLQPTSTVPAGLHASLIGLNIFLSITASLSNALILIALHKVTSIYPPTKVLFRCLAVTDLCVGLISQPLFCITLTGRITNINNKVFSYSDQLNTASSNILFIVSILTSTAISVDRLLALLLGMRYRHVVTLRRVRAVVVCFWFLSGVLNGWKIGAMTPGAPFITVRAFMLMSLLISVFSYMKIYLRLRHYQLQVQGHVQQAQPPNGGAAPLNIARYKKTVSSIAWVQFALLVCYLPFIVASMLIVYEKLLGSAVGIAYFRVALSIIYLNSSVNPILYCWKIREVKKSAKDTIRQLKCCITS